MFSPTKRVILIILLTWSFPIVVIVLSDASTGEAKPPDRRILSFVVDLKVVDPVRWHGLHDAHVVDQRFAPGLTFGLFVVFNNLQDNQKINLKSFTSQG